MKYPKWTPTQALVSSAVVDLTDHIIDGYRLSAANPSEEDSRVYRATRVIDLEKAVIKFSAQALPETTILTLTRSPVFPMLLASGEHEGSFFAILQDFDGGDLLDRIGNGMSLQSLISTVRQVALALDELHEIGYVHGDIKPEHIVFTHTGSPGLIDFGSATSIKEPPQTDTTTDQRDPLSPGYASPEQIIGKSLDGRSDLYSLGVLLYQMLAGQVPYTDPDAKTMLQKHIQDPIPRLPNYLATLQPIIDLLLAKRPEKRYQSGKDLSYALSAIASDALLPDVAIKTQAIKTQEISVLRAELRTVALDPVEQQKRARRKRRRKIALQSFATLFIMGVVFGVAFLLREQVTASLTNVGSSLGVIEDPQLVFARTEAESLRQDPNQGLAAIAGAYQRIFLLEPNDMQAQIALDEVLKSWRDSINLAMTAGNLETAELRLQEAVSVLGEDPELTVLSLRLQNRYRAERLLKSTQALLASHGLSDLPSAAAAIQAYQEILRIAPQHPGAERGLTELSAHYIGLAKVAAEGGEVNNAISLLERASAANNNLRELDDVRKLISQAATAQAAINELLVQARRLRAENLFIQPAGANAAELYQRVLTTDPNNMVALQGLNEVAAQISNSVREQLAQGRLDSAEDLLDQASAAGLPAQPISELRQRIENERSRQARVVVLLEQSQELMSKGYLTAPIENNATALLREVLQLDPSNTPAKNLLNVCARRLSQAAQEAYEYKLRDTAKEYMDLALTINPDVVEWVALREKWGSD